MCLLAAHFCTLIAIISQILLYKLNKQMVNKVNNHHSNNYDNITLYNIHIISYYFVTRRPVTKINKTINIICTRYIQPYNKTIISQKNNKKYV